jgi:hypothetical protein
MTQFAPYLRTTPQSPRVGRKQGANPNFCALLAPLVLTLELVFFIFIELFQACVAEERTRVSDGGGNRGSSGKYNNQL